MKASFSIQRLLFVITWLGLLFGHAQLCYPAMINRGHPPLIAEHFTALFVAPLFVWLPSIFSDRKTRSLGVFIGAIGFAFIYALVKTNLESARPHIGHTHGVLGIINGQWLMLVTQWAILYVPTVLALYFLERVLGDILGARLRQIFRRTTD